MSISLTHESLIAMWEEFFKNYYKSEIEDMSYAYPSQRSLTIDYRDLEKDNLELADCLVNKPTETLYAGEKALKNMLENAEELARIHLRVKNLSEANHLSIREIRSEHLGKLVAIEGLIKKVTEVRPKIENAFFQCKLCGTTIKVFQEEDLLTQPLRCYEDQGGCGRNGGFKLLIEQSQFIDQEKVEIQESPDFLRGGEQPQCLTLYIEDDLVGKLTPGDRIIINGVIRTQQRRRGSLKLTEFDKVMDAISVEHQQLAYEEVLITPEDEKEIKKLGKQPDIYGQLRKSIAPTIWGMEAEKEALVLQLFSGIPKLMPDGTRIRGDIHVLLVGDPSTAKSQLLRYIANLTPRSIYASGKTSSAAGLTAAAVKDEFGEGRWSLEAGALVLADMGIACIDELDKISPEDRSALHQAMEQQEISIAKAGINTTLKSRCALLGAANPKYGRFDEFQPLPDQIDMPPTLLSRFDLIFPIIDKPNKEKDERLANHLLEVHKFGEQVANKKEGAAGFKANLREEIKPKIDPQLLRKYIAWTKRNVIPVLTPEASNLIKNYFVGLRGASSESIPCSPRQMEALIRLAEASARARLSSKVERRDAERAIEIMEYFLQKVGLDRETGRIDIDIIATGRSRFQQTNMQKLMGIIKDLAAKSPEGTAPKSEIISEGELAGIPAQKTEELLQSLRKQGFIYEPRSEKYDSVRK